MTARQRQEIKAHRQQFQEEQERPLKEAEAQLMSTANALARLERDRVANGVDEKFAESISDEEIDNILAASELTEEELAFTNAANRDVFFHCGAPYLKTEKNAQTMLDYLERNYRAHRLPFPVTQDPKEPLLLIGHPKAGRE
jgi:hypothetical protein